jgi:hypothetical protein
LNEDHPPTPARFLDFDRGGLDCDRGGPGPSFAASAVYCYESLKVLEDHVEGELEKCVKAESELNERMGNDELASENMKKVLLDKGHADYAKMSAALYEIELALEQNDFRSAVPPKAWPQRRGGGLSLVTGRPRGLARVRKASCARP